MTNSDRPQEVEDVLKRLLSLLDMGQIQRAVDEPLEEAASAFKDNAEGPVTQRLLLEIAGRFIAHIYARGLRFPQALSVVQAQAEALWLLQSGYVAAYEKGYSAALVDATDASVKGIEVVLAALVQIVRTRERDKYVNGILNSIQDPLDWKTKCLVATGLFERLHRFLPEKAAHFTPGQLADEWAYLFEIDQDTDRALGEMVQGAFSRGRR